MIGNSSSGIIETPSLFKPSINIGNRQKGRVKAKSVIDSKQSLEAIKDQLNLEFLKIFKNLKDLTNPYGKGDSSIKIVEQIKKINLNELLAKISSSMRICFVGNVKFSREMLKHFLSKDN